MRSETAVARCGVRDIEPLDKRNGSAQHNLVEEVVNHEHLGCGVAPGTVNAAVETCRVDNVEFSFPDVREFYSASRV
jgi:hypothetical protein